jgi:DNA-binding response OmpR family regulator
MQPKTVNEPDDIVATILVVDDERPIRQALRRFLSADRHAVLEAADGVEALEMLKENEVDVAIIDLMMPRMDGLELLSHMRHERVGVKVIVTSAFDEIIELTGRDADIVTTLRKPFELAEVAKALHSALHEC